MNKELLKAFLITRDKLVSDLMKLIGLNARGIAILTDDDDRLVSTFTDGDVRRGFLDGLKMEDTVGDLLDNKSSRGLDRVFTLEVGATDKDCLELMRDEGIRQLPIVDEARRPVDIVFKDELLGSAPMRLSAVRQECESDGRVETLAATGVIMAGGFGTRLRPLTDDLPKPMLPIDGRPLLEIIIEKFECCGIRDLKISTYFKKEVIEDYFGEGGGHGVQIDYIHETSPLGTAGALSLIEDVRKPLVLTNGDVLTKVDFSAMLDFHNDHEAYMTVGVRQYDFKVPFGVMKTQGEKVTGVEEKPVYEFLVNGGIYVISPEAHALIPENERFDMTDLVEAVIAKGMKVAAFPIVEYWLDIGQLDDYNKAQSFDSEG